MSQFKNISFYKSLSAWTPIEAASLINNIMPESINKRQLPENVSRIMDMIYRAIETEDLEVLKKEYQTPDDDYPTEYFSPFVFLEWAKKLEISIHQGFDFKINYPDPPRYSYADYDEGRAEDWDGSPIYQWVDYKIQKDNEMARSPQKLNANGYAFYRTLDYWEPLEASAVICGIDPETIDFESMPENVENIYKLLERSYNRIPDDFITEYILVTNSEKTDFLNKYSSSFFSIQRDGYLVCFDAIALIQWIKYNMGIPIPVELELEREVIPF